MRQRSEAWDAQGALSSEEWQRETSRLKELRDEINGFAEDLDKVHSNGLTVHDAIWRSVANGGDPVPTLHWPSRTEHSRDQLEQMADQVRRLELTHLGLEALPPEVLGSVAAREWNIAFQARLLTATQGLRSATASYEAAALAAQ